MPTLKRKTQQKLASANYRAKVKQYIAYLEGRIRELMAEVEKYKN